METTFKETKIGRIPEDWEIAFLGKYCKVQGGCAFRSSDYIEEGAPLVRISNIKDGVVDCSDSPQLPLDYVKQYPEFVVKKGDMLIAMSGATTGKVGIYNSIKPVLLNQRVGRYIVTDKNKLLQDFLRFLVALPSYRNKALVDANGAAQPNVAPSRLEHIIIAIPPLPEQRKIAEVLSTVDEAIEKTDAVIRETQQLKKGLMHKLFTEGIGHTRFKETILADVEKPIGQRGHQLEQFRILPQDWDIVGCDKVFSLEYGKGLTESERDGGDFPVVGSAGIVGHHSQKLAVGPGMVVGRKGGAGIVTYVKDDFWPIDTTYFVKLKGKYDVDWLYYILNFLKLTRLGEGTVPGLNRTDVYHLYIPLPSLPEQHQIAEILSEVDIKIEKEQAFKSELEQLKKGLMQVLLAGQVRVKV